MNLCKILIMLCLILIMSFSSTASERSNDMYTNEMVDDFIRQTDNIELEVKNARFSLLNGKKYLVLRQRLDEIESNIQKTYNELISNSEETFAEINNLSENTNLNTHDISTTKQNIENITTKIVSIEQLLELLILESETFNSNFNSKLTEHIQEINNIKNQLALLKLTNNRSIMALDYSSVVKKENFVDGLDNWIYTKGIGIANNELTLITDETPVYTNVVLYDSVKNPRTVEVTLGTTGNPLQARIAFGIDINNFTFITISNTSKLVSAYTVEGGKYIGKVAEKSFASEVNLAPGAKIKIARYGQSVQVFVDDVLLGTLIPTTTKFILQNGNLLAGVSFRNLSNNFSVSNIKLQSSIKSKYVHVSVDDVIDILKDLTDNASMYSSIFDNPQLAFLKKMHENYGAVFSLYCFYEKNGWNISQTTTKFSEEFRNNSTWLKFGFHAANNSSNYGNGTISVADALSQYNNTINAIRTFAHGNSIDSVIRTHAFSGSLDVCRALRDSEFNLQGFLTSDDSRTYDLYLDSVQREAVEKCDDYFDPVEKLYFVRTDIRLESFEDVVSELEQRKSNSFYNGQNDVLTIFTHENRIMSQEQYTNIENVIKWAIENGYVFDFPMNNIPKF